MGAALNDIAYAVNDTIKEPAKFKALNVLIQEMINNAVMQALNSTIKNTEEFKPLNELITEHGVQTFTSNGTFTVPKGVYKILVTAAGGGQAGFVGKMLGASTYRYYGGKGGNGGDCIFKQPYNVTPGQVINITVGKGGTTSGEVGTSTIIGNLVTLVGGSNVNNGSNNGGGTGGFGGHEPNSSNNSFDYRPQPGRDGILGSGGSAGTHYPQDASGGGGGGSIGNGGNGLISSVASENTGINGKQGGGGGGGFSNSGLFGKGGDGIVIIEW